MTRLKKSAPAAAGREGDEKSSQAEALLLQMGWEIPHSLHVRRLSLLLFDQLGELHHLGAAERAVLDAAALLHDIGWLVGKAGHHKRSRWMILKHRQDLTAFTSQQIEMVSLVAGYHRKAPPSAEHPVFACLDKTERWTVRCLAAILRIADSLDRFHIQAVESLGCEPDERRVRIIVRARAQARKHRAAGARKKRLFEKVFKRKVVFCKAA